WDNDIELLGPIIGLVAADQLNQLDASFLRKTARAVAGAFNSDVQELTQAQNALTSILAQLPAATASAIQSSFSASIMAAQAAGNEAALASQDADDAINSAHTAATLQNNNDSRAGAATSEVQTAATSLNAQVQAANTAAQSALGAVNATVSTLTSAAGAATGDVATTLTQIDNTIVQVAAQTVQNNVTQLTNLLPSAVHLATDVGAVLVAHILAATVGEVFEFAAGGDIVAPAGNNSDNLKDRGILTHEYGHFTLCSLLEATSPLEFGVVYDTAAAEAVITTNSDPSQMATVLNESFADTIASQVLGGTNYASPTNSQSSQGKSAGTNIVMHYCQAAKADSDPMLDPSQLGLAPPGPCIEDNNVQNVFTVDSAGNESDLPTNNDFDTAVLRNVAMYTDVFDGTPGGTNDPSNGAVWALSGGGGSSLVLSQSPGQAGNDDVVTASGTLFQSWINHTLSRGTSLSDDNMLGGLNDAMVDQNINWCARCQIFRLHTNDAGGNPVCPSQWVGQPPTFELNGVQQTLTCTFNGPCPMGTAKDPASEVCLPTTCPEGMVFDPVKLMCIQSINIG
ncbi:MAG TPA: hypothetical protein VGP64_13025, partial [Polyangia bacterium]